MKLSKHGRLLGNGLHARVAAYPTGVSFIAVAVVVLAIAAFATMTAAYSFLYHDKIYPGISVLDADIGGRSEEGARSLVLSRVNDLERSELTIRYGDRNWTVALAEFGLGYDVDRMVRDGFSFGRRGSVLAQLADRVRALVTGLDARPAIWFDRTTQERVLGQVAAEVNRPPVNAEISLSADGTMRIAPSQTGLAVDIDETLRRFESSFSPRSTRELNLVVREVAPDVAEADLVRTQTTGQTIIEKPLTLKAGDKTWTIGEKDLLRMLTFSRSDDQREKVVARLDRTMLARYLEPIAAEVNRQPKNAAVEYRNGTVVVVESVDGLVLDVDATIAAINAQAVGDARTVDLVFKKQRPDIVEADLQEAKANAEKMISEPLTLKYGDLSWTLSRAELGDLLVFETGEAAGGRKVVASFDKESLASFLKRIGQRVEKPARDARFRFQDGQLSLISESVDGIEVDVDTTFDAITSQTQQGNHVVSLATAVQEPKVRSSDKDRIVIKDLLKESKTSYAGGIPERNHNVELAASRLNGVVIPPGETFSMNQALGPATLAAGFKIGYGITISGTEMVTVPSEAGGICQVATTLYHAAFWSGLPIVQRLEHMYWIPRYGQPPLGMKGLDATVDAPYVDLKFRNTTGNWLAIQSRTDGSNIFFSIYGTRTGWEVKVDGPKISNVVPADTTMVYKEDPTMPWGKQLLVEHAEDGFTATIVRTVYKDGEVIDRYTSVSRYRPSRNVTLVGTKGRPAQVPGQNPQGMPTQGTPVQGTPAQGTPTPGNPTSTSVPSSTPGTRTEPTPSPARNA